MTGRTLKSKMIVERLEQLHGEYKVIYQDLKP